jgi:hypothetical protein
MAIKVSGATRIDNSRNGIFVGCAPGSGSSFPTAAAGKMWFNTSDKNMYIYTSGSWVKLT